MHYYIHITHRWNILTGGWLIKYSAQGMYVVKQLPCCNHFQLIPPAPLLFREEKGGEPDKLLAATPLS